MKYSLNRDDAAFRGIQHLSIDIDDMDDQDMLVHFPRIVRFIHGGLSSAGPSRLQNLAADTPAPPVSPTAQGASASPDSPSGAVLVHCAMGKSRSATAVIAFLLWKYPHRFGKADSATTARDAVARALQWVRETRPIAEPNDGFMRQLEMWWDMGCPADSDDAVEKNPAYQRWLYKREVEDAARIGRAPGWIRFEDEEAQVASDKATGRTDSAAGGTELRCKKCRRVLATAPFLVPHRGRGNTERSDCPHFFIEALSWMRPILEEGALDGRLICPNAKCAASIGRYAWQGFKCSCGEWVAPAFSLQSSKVDKVVAGRKQHGDASAIAERMAALGIRMPPGAAARPTVSEPGVDTDKCKENL
jgi:dual specificity phosphatase 12